MKKDENFQENAVTAKTEAKNGSQTSCDCFRNGPVVAWSPDGRFHSYYEKPSEIKAKFPEPASTVILLTDAKGRYLTIDKPALCGGCYFTSFNRFNPVTKLAIVAASERYLDTASKRTASKRTDGEEGLNLFQFADEGVFPPKAAS